MIFQAIGATYSFGGALRVLFARGNARHHQALRDELSRRYGGSTTLYRKGRAALSEAVRVAGSGDSYVLISGLTCYSVVQAVEAAGATPIYVDIDRDALQPTKDTIERAFREHDNVRAIIVQNMLGVPADIDGIMELARTHNLVVIEDLAHSAGAQYESGQEVGTVGDVTMLSFGKDKSIDAVNGGAVIVRSKRLTRQAHQPAGRARLRDRLRDRCYPLIAWTTRALYPVGVGAYVMSAAIRLKLVVRSADGDVLIDEALPNWQAHRALRQLNKLDLVVAARRKKAALYQQYLADDMPARALQSGASLVRVPLIVQDRNALFRTLAQHGIQAHDTWYDTTVSPMRFADLIQYPDAANPESVDVAAHIINLPTHERIAEKDIKRIAEIVTQELRS